MATLFRQAITLAVIALLPAVATAVFHPKKPAWRSDEIVLGMVQTGPKKVLWIDARAHADYNRAHVPGALPLNEDEWEAELPAILDAWNGEQIIVVYCSSLSCQTSREVARRLREEVGLPQAYALEGGWEAWQRGQK